MIFTFGRMKKQGQLKKVKMNKHFKDLKINCNNELSFNTCLFTC